jgi:hypothetical protein
VIIGFAQGTQNESVLPSLPDISYWFALLATEEISSAEDFERKHDALLII